MADQTVASLLAPSMARDQIRMSPCDRAVSPRKRPSGTANTGVTEWIA